jgi:hypothetical protein
VTEVLRAIMTAIKARRARESSESAANPAQWAP